MKKTLLYGNLGASFRKIDKKYGIVVGHKKSCGCSCDMPDNVG
jgi:hypothetical protein